MTIDFKKLATETEDEYIVRVCSRKEDIGSWDEVGDILNKELGYNFSSSKYRKPYQAGLLLWEVNKKKYLEDDYLLEVEKAKRELRAERNKLRTLNIYKNREERIEDRLDLFLENLSDIVETLPLPEFKPLPKKEEGSLEWILGIADMHYGATFVSENNEYSRDICKQRLEYLAGFCKDFCVKNNIRTLKVLNGGDTLQGILRLTDLKINDISVMEATVEVSRLLAQFLNEISSECKIEYYHVSQANHTQTRPLGSKASELFGEDLEKIIVSYISDLVRNNERIKVFLDLEKGYLTFDIFEHKCVFLHGHQIKNKKKSVQDLSSLHDMKYDYTFVGHTHSANEIIVSERKNHNVEVITIPSLIGSDRFSDSLFVGAKGSAKFYGFHKDYGHIENKLVIL